MDQEQKSNIAKAWPVYLFFLCLLGIIFWHLDFGGEKARNQTLKKSIADAYRGESDDASDGSGPSLMQIARRARGWGPIWENYYGKTAPDFSVSDIAGTEHTLSKLRGKDVMLIFWGTWCVYCVEEIPDFIKLRNEVSRDDLVMLAISDEPESVVKPFAEKKKLNYSVISSQAWLPEPYRRISGYPTTCFIDKEGKLKFAATGAMPIKDIGAVLKATH